MLLPVSRPFLSPPTAHPINHSYDANGVLTGQAGAARTTGTTVAVRDLFKRLPVRCGAVQYGSAVRGCEAAGLSLCGDLS